MARRAETARGGAQRRRAAAHRGQGRDDLKRGRRAGAAHARLGRARCELLKRAGRDQQWVSRAGCSARSSRASGRTSRRGSAASASTRCAPGRADAAQPARGAGPARRALHHGGEEGLALGRRAAAGGRCRRRRRRAYAGAADAISVLTDGPYFGGSLDDLAAVRRGLRRADPRQGFRRRSAPGRRGAAARRRRGAGRCSRCSTTTRRGR